MLEEQKNFKAEEEHVWRSQSDGSNAKQSQQQPVWSVYEPWESRETAAYTGQNIVGSEVSHFNSFFRFVLESMYLLSHTQNQTDITYVSIR